MAKQKPFIFTGKIANIIFYEFRGVQCSRSRPKRVPPTKASKASAHTFGIASRMSSMIRSGLERVLPDPKDKKMMYRLNTVFGQWLRSSQPGKDTVMTDIPFIYQFQFNPESELNARVKQGLMVNWTMPDKIQLTIPQLDPPKDIAAPSGTETVKWKIGAVRCKISDRPSLTAAHSTELDMPCNEGIQNEKQIDIPITPIPGEITLVTISLIYKARRNGELKMIEEKRWLPMGVVGACCGKPA